MGQPMSAFLENVTEALADILHEEDIEHARYLVDLKCSDGWVDASYSATAVAEQIAEKYGYA